MPRASSSPRRASPGWKPRNPRRSRDMSVSFRDVDEAKLPPPRVVGPLTRTDFVRYQGASGDMNPIHHDEEFARSAGYPAPLSVGMFQAALLATWATDWLGAEAVRGFRVRFAQPVWPGDTLTCSGRVVREYAEDGECRV